jgi:hypothetical protein
VNGYLCQPADRFHSPHSFFYVSGKKILYCNPFSHTLHLKMEKGQRLSTMISRLQGLEGHTVIFRPAFCARLTTHALGCR